MNRRLEKEKKKSCSIEERGKEGRGEVNNYNKKMKKIYNDRGGVKCRRKKEEWKK
jgi:hypothetical protein